MRAKECIKLAASFLADKKMEELLDKCTEENIENFTGGEQKLLGSYLGAFNIAVKTIAAEEISLTNVERLVSDSEARIFYSAFNSDVYEIKMVVDKELDAVVDFFSLPFGVYVPKAGREYLVRYKYLPREVESIEDEVELDPRVNKTLVAKLMASDLLMAKNVYDEASLWRSEYKKEAARLARPRKVMAQRKLM